MPVRSGRSQTRLRHPACTHGRHPRRTHGMKSAPCAPRPVSSTLPAMRALSAPCARRPVPETRPAWPCGPHSRRFQTNAGTHPPHSLTKRCRRSQTRGSPGALPTSQSLQHFPYSMAACNRRSQTVWRTFPCVIAMRAACTSRAPRPGRPHWLAGPSRPRFPRCMAVFSAAELKRSIHHTWKAKQRDAHRHRHAHV